MRIWFIDTINAVDIEATKYVTNLDVLQETLSFDESTRTVTTSTTSTIEVRGKENAAYKLLKDTFYNCNNNTCTSTSLKIKIEIDCCNGRIREYMTSATIVDWCFSSCYFSVDLEISNSITDIFDYLNKTFFWAESTGFIENFIEQSGEINIHRYLMPDTTGGSLEPYLLAYKVVDIIKYHLEQKNIQLISSIAESEPYSQMTFGFSSYQLVGVTWDETILPELTILDLVDLFAQATNCEYRLIEQGGVKKLFIEPEEFFSLSIERIPLSYFKNEDEICLGYVEKDTNDCASTRFKYQVNGVTDREIEASFEYSDLLVWESKPTRRKKCEIIIPLHAPLIEDDGRLVRLNQSDISPETPVVVIWSGSKNAAGYSIPINLNGEDFNYPMKFNKDSPTGLYQQRFTNKNPDLSGCEIESKKDLQLMADGVNLSFCTILDLLDEFGLNLGFEIQADDCKYVILAKEITINYDRKTITLQDTFVTS